MKMIMRTKVYIAGMLFCFTAEAIAESDYMISAGNKEQRFSSYYSDYASCKSSANQKPSRGEYETKEEYRARLQKIAGGCDSYKNLRNVVVTVPVSLSYNVDNERFLFEMPMKSQSLEFDYAAITYDDFPSSVYKDNYKQYGRGGSSAPFHPHDSDEYLLRPCGLHIDLNKKYFYQAKSVGDCKARYVAASTKKNMWGETVVTKNSAWHQRGGYQVRKIAFNVFSPVQSARKLKVLEPNLVFLVGGDMDVSEKKMKVKDARLVNLENDEILLSVSN